MKKTVKRVILMALVLAMCASLAVPAFAAPAHSKDSVNADAYWYKFNTNTTMYQYPDTSSAIVCYVEKGIMATISRTDGSWSYVCLGVNGAGTTGYWGYVKRSTLTYDHYGEQSIGSSIA